MIVGTDALARGIPRDLTGEVDQSHTVDDDGVAQDRDLIQHNGIDVVI
jgi:hypothetical protein